MKTITKDLQVPELHYRLIKESFLRSYIAPRFEQQYQLWLARRLGTLPQEIEERLRTEFERTYEKRYAEDCRRTAYFMHANGVLSVAVALAILLIC